MGTKKVKISATKRAHHLSKKKKVTKGIKSKKGGTKANQLSSSFNDNTKKTPKKKLPKKKNQNLNNNNNNNKDEEEEDIELQGDDYIQMMDEEDLEDMENIGESVGKFSLNTNVVDLEDNGDIEHAKRRNKKTKKYLHKVTEDGDATQFESMYNEYHEDNKREEMKPLLPIKTKDGNVIMRMTKVFTNIEDNKDDDVNMEEVEEEAEYDSDADIVNMQPEKEIDNKKSISTADLLIRREQEIQKQKFRIGIICSGILEKPEGKMKNFAALIEMMDSHNPNGSFNLVSIRKLAMISTLELFKDITPEYKVGFVDLKQTKVRKLTLERVNFENQLLLHLKNFLQKLEKFTKILTKKNPIHSNHKHQINDQINIAEVAVDCLCELLVAHPYFNYSQNIAQLLAFLANCNNIKVRETVNKAIKEIFKNDKRFDLSLYIVRRLNFIIKKTANNVYSEVITTLLSLPLKNINLDAEKEKELKQKKKENHRQRILSLSKREKKRNKKLQEIERDLQETEAEEKKQTKQYKLTEITKTIFTIYFRILKNDPNSKLLSCVLEGLAKFAHLINMDFFSDLVNVLNVLMETGDLGYREQLFCIQTVFTILSGQGEMLNIDPHRFYTHFYRNILEVNAGKYHNDLTIILRTLEEVLIKRRKHLTQQRLLAFVKRVSVLALQLDHNGTLGVLGIIKMAFQFNSSLEILLDTDSSFGSGQYNPELEEPEHCYANCTALYEMTALQRHYHPMVKKYARHITTGIPISGEGSLNPEVGKLTPNELFKEFDSSYMAFNPSIPTPLNVEAKKKPGRHYYMDKTFEKYCNDNSRRCISTKENDNLNFCVEYWNNLEIQK